MRLLELHLKAYGPFTNQVLKLGSGEQRLVLVHGANEAGKSTALRAIAGLRFQIDERSPDRYVHDYPQLRIGGVFMDRQGRSYALMRRKGRGNTLQFHDFATGKDLDEPVPEQLQSLLTGGYSLRDYQAMFGLDHAALRQGGKALAQGEGDVGAALFEASAGTGSIRQILAAIDGAARGLYLAGGNAQHASINQALRAYKSSHDEHARLLVRPAVWEKLEREAEDSKAALALALARHQGLLARQLQVTELLAVSPALAALARSEAELAASDAVPLLDEDTPARHAAAHAGLLDARASAASARQAAEMAQAAALAITPDAALLSAAAAIAALHAAVPVIVQLQTEISQADADIARRSDELATQARAIDAQRTPDQLLALAPTPTARVELDEAVAALDTATARLGAHAEAAAGAQAPGTPPPAAPDAAAALSLRTLLGEVARTDGQQRRLQQLPGDIAAAARRVAGELAALGLPDEARAGRVRPLLGARVDDELALRSQLAARRQGLDERLQAMTTELARQNTAIAGLLAHGEVPTRDELRLARAARDEAWARLRTVGVSLAGADAGAGAGADAGASGSADARITSIDTARVDAYQAARTRVDHIVDGLLQHYERATELELARAKVAELHGDIQARGREVEALDTQAGAADAAWRQALDEAAIPPLPPSQLRDWQARLDSLKASLDSLAAQREELRQLQEARLALTARLKAPIGRLALTPLQGDETLDTLVAVGEENLRRVDAIHTLRSQAEGQAAQWQQQLTRQAQRQAQLAQALAAARAQVDSLSASVLLPAASSVAVIRSRIAEFVALLGLADALGEARSRAAAKLRLWRDHQAQASAIAQALGQAVPAPTQLTLAAGEWARRLEAEQARAQARAAALQRGQSALAQLADHEAALQRHQATLDELCRLARVHGADELPAALDAAARKRQCQREVDKDRRQLAQASLRSRAELEALLSGQDVHALQARAADLAEQLNAAAADLDTARSRDEAARRALDGVDASGAAADAAEAADRALTTVRQALPLLMRNRLAHALLQEAVRRFQERRQAPMLLKAAAYFARLTGGEFDALRSDDAEGRPVLKARRSGSDTLVGVEALSEGTLDQLYLALRLAALELQRDAGKDLPLVLDDVLMTSDDARAGCILRALADYSRGGQVIVFTHHAHLCDIARASVDEAALAVVALTRGG